MVTGHAQSLEGLTDDSVAWLLERWGSGDRDAALEVLPHVYEQLRRIARRTFRFERREHTLQPTALVHEAYDRLIADHGMRWQNREQFFGVAACMMRRILVDHARQRNRLKRGGTALRVTLAEASAISHEAPPDVERLHEALRELAIVDPLKASVVELRVFGGMSIPETAACLDIAPITVSRHWRRAKAWLYTELVRTGA